MKRFLLFAAILSVGMLAWAEYPSSRWKNLTVDNTANIEIVDTSDIITRSPWFDIRSYGAIDGGSSTITGNSIQSAINAAGDAGGGIVYIPSGLWNITTLTVDDNNVQIIGNGRSSILHSDTSNNTIITVNGADNSLISGFAIRDIRAIMTSASSSFLKLNRTYDPLVDRVDVTTTATSNTGTGINLIGYGSWLNSPFIERNYITGFKYGIVADNLVNGGVIGWNVILGNNVSIVSGSKGIYTESGGANSTTIIGNIIEYYETGIYNLGTRNLIVHNRYENNTTHYLDNSSAGSNSMLLWNNAWDNTEKTLITNLTKSSRMDFGYSPWVLNVYDGTSYSKGQTAWITGAADDNVVGMEILNGVVSTTVPLGGIGVFTRLNHPGDVYDWFSGLIADNTYKFNVYSAAGGMRIGTGSANHTVEIVSNGIAIVSVTDNNIAAGSVYINHNALPTYDNNDSAMSGGLDNGYLYKTSTGQLMIRF